MRSTDLSHPGADVGLLAPVRAASPVEAATGDAAFLQAMLDAEAALTRAQAALGMVPSAAAAAVRAAADARAFDLPSLAARAREHGNPVIPLVADLTAAVAARDPDAAPYVHLGATSQDILDTAMMLVAHRALGLVLADLDRAAAALAPLAAAHRDVPMPGRTLTQHAVPTTAGLKIAGWYRLVREAADRLERVHRSLPAQLGGAGGTLAAFDEHAGRPVGLALLARFAAEVGLAEPVVPWHSLRTPIADLGAALAFTAGALGKVAADVLVLSRTEIGEIVEGGGRSSAMPHKSNPVRATLVAAASRQLPALAAVLIGALAAEDERPAGAWHAEWQALREALRLAGGAARAVADLVADLDVRPERMRVHLEVTHGLIVSERVSAALTPLVGRATAARIVSRACDRVAQEGMSLAAALADEPALAGVMTPEQLTQLADPTGYLGAAAALVDRALRSSRGEQREPSACA